MNESTRRKISLKKQLLIAPLIKIRIHRYLQEIFYFLIILPLKYDTSNFYNCSTLKAKVALTFEFYFMRVNFQLENWRKYFKNTAL